MTGGMGGLERSVVREGSVVDRGRLAGRLSGVKRLARLKEWERQGGWRAGCAEGGRGQTTAALCLRLREEPGWRLGRRLEQVGRCERPVLGGRDHREERRPSLTQQIHECLCARQFLNSWNRKNKKKPVCRELNF